MRNFLTLYTALLLITLYATHFVAAAKTKQEELDEQHRNDFISFDVNQDGQVDAQEVRAVY